MTETQAITQAVHANPAGRVNRQETQTHPIAEANPTDPVVLGLDGSTKTIPNDAVAALRSKLYGSVALPGEDGYDAARTIWNAMVDRRPGLVVRVWEPTTSSIRSGSRATKGCWSLCAREATTSPAMQCATAAC